MILTTNNDLYWYRHVRNSACHSPHVAVNTHEARYSNMHVGAVKGNPTSSQTLGRFHGVLWRPASLAFIIWLYVHVRVYSYANIYGYQSNRLCVCECLWLMTFKQCLYSMLLLNNGVAGMLGGNNLIAGDAGNVQNPTTGLHKYNAFVVPRSHCGIGTLSWR